ERVVIERRPLWTDKRGEHGPFDIIGDVHGCYDELLALLKLLGYVVPESADAAEIGRMCHHPEERKAIFVGDFVDRGPRTPDALKLVMGMVEAGRSLCVMGNHDSKLPWIIVPTDGGGGGEGERGARERARRVKDANFRRSAGLYYQ